MFTINNNKYFNINDVSTVLNQIDGTRKLPEDVSQDDQNKVYKYYNEIQDIMLEHKNRGELIKRHPKTFKKMRSYYAKKIIYRETQDGMVVVPLGLMALSLYSLVPPKMMQKFIDKCRLKLASKSHENNEHITNLFKQTIENIKEECEDPITSELATDAVATSDGHTYNHATVRRLIDSGQDEPFKVKINPLVYNNLAVKNIIEHIQNAEKELNCSE